MTNHAYSFDASGVIGSEKRRKPYAPSFSMMAASTTEPPVVASTCASGGQGWASHIGTFTGEEAKQAKNSSARACNGRGSLRRVSMPKLPPDVQYREVSATIVS